MRRWEGLLTLWIVWLLAWAQDAPRILPGVSLRITVEGDESLSRVYVVDSTGAFRMPLIGLVQAAGRKPEELAAEIARRLREGQFYRDPKVTVEIAQRAEAKVTIQGAVRRGGEFTLLSGWRLSDALKEAQPTDTADLSAVRLERLNGERLTLNHLKFVQEGDESANPPLQPGDRIFVPLRAGGRNVLVLGAVRSPGSFEFDEAKTLIQALGKAGGTLPEADTARIQIRRANRAEPIVVNLNTLQGDVDLQPGDQINVPFRSARQFIVVRGGVNRAGLVNYAENMTLTQAIEAAGGPKVNAILERVVILRPTERGRQQRITVNLLEVAQGTRPDERLLPGDTVEVPEPPQRRASAEEPLRILWLILSIIYLVTRR
ncbi:MAG: SLBB domain-containing protein [Fimbriimonadales bacterium]|nr:SLBB domain-containing protein [Fimbriimonadales bacterium]